MSGAWLTPKSFREPPWCHLVAYELVKNCFETDRIRLHMTDLENSRLELSIDPPSSGADEAACFSLFIALFGVLSPDHSRSDVPKLDR